MKARVIPLAAACLLAINLPCKAQEVRRQYLRGLDALYVNVRLEEEGGLTADAIQTYAEMRLRQARIRILSESQWLTSERKPALEITIAALQTTAGGWVFTLDLRVYQEACIKRLESVQFPSWFKEGCAMLITWSDEVLYKGPENLPDMVRSQLSQLMDTLLNDYLAVNP